MNGDLFAPLSRPDQPTSQAAEKELKKSGRHAEQVAFVSKMVGLYPGRTAREHDEGFIHSRPTLRGEGTFHKRLKDCERRGLVKRGEPRRCSISGRTSYTWLPV